MPAKDFAEHDRPNASVLADAAYTLQTGHRRFSSRRYVVCSEIADAVAALEEQGSKKSTYGSAQTEFRRPVIFLLPGVGDHYVGMGQGLYEHFGVFRQEIDRCAQILQPLLDSDVRQLLYPSGRVRKEAAKSPAIDLKRMLGRATDEPPDPAAQKLDQTINNQPALFSLEYALARLWLDWGVQPDRMVGHSMGEYVAACLAGVFSLEDSLRLIAVRAKLVSELPPGAMLAVMLSEEKLLPLLNEQLSISLINGPNLCVVAGPVAAMADLQSRLTEQQIIFRPVRNTHAFHSRMLDPILESFAREVKQVRLNVPRIPFISNVTGTWITDEQALDPFYWVDHARRTARFSDALEQLWKLPDCLALEVGPGRTLGMLAMQHPARISAVDPLVVSSVRHDYENQPDAEFILNSIGQLWLEGTEINWENLDQRSSRRKIFLPAYPFETKRRGGERDTGIQSATVTGRPLRAKANEVNQSLSPAFGAQKKVPPFTSTSEAHRNESVDFDSPSRANRVALPGTPTEIALAQIWSEALDVKQIRLHDNFFDLGGHSLQAMRVIGEVRKRFGKAVQMGSVFTAPTIFQFARLLDEKANGSVSLSQALHGSGIGTPLFFVPEMNGYGFLPRDLHRHLKVNCRFYEGLQYPGLNGGEPMPETIEEIAAYLIPQIQLIWPQGPYYLCGWSFGGTVAFEVARQMEARGLKVQLVVLLDSCCPSKNTHRPSVMGIVANLKRDLLTLSWWECQVFLANLAIKRSTVYSSRALRFLGILPPEILPPLWEATKQAALKYQPGHYGGRAALFHSRFSGFRFAPDPTFGWGELVRGDLEIISVPGDHNSMMHEPAVGRIAERIHGWLNEGAQD